MTKTKLAHLAAGMLLSVPASGYAEVNFAQQPLFSGGSVEANMLFILDDSGSMRWGFMPDELVNPGVTGGGSQLPNCSSYIVYDSEDFCGLKKEKRMHKNRDKNKGVVRKQV